MESPQLQGHLGHHELVLNFSHQGLGQLLGAIDQQKILGPPVQAVCQNQVLIAIPDHLHQARFVGANFLAQHVGLALLQAHRPLAMGIGNSDL